MIVTFLALLALAGRTLMADRPIDGAGAGVADQGAQSSPKFAPVNLRAGAGDPAPDTTIGAQAPSSAVDVVPLADAPVDALVNNNNGASGTSAFTQSETSTIAFGNTIIASFNDSGSNASSANQFTGWARSTDGGATWTDGGLLPASAGGDAGDPVLARNETTGRIYFATLGFSVGTIQVFRSDNNGATWQAPVNGTPGGASEDKEWITVDNFPGAGNGNVYLISRNFGGGAGIFLYRSTDNGNTFGPSGGVSIVAGNQGAYVAVGPDHSVYAFWFAGSTIQMRKSTNFGVSFGAPVTVATFLTTGGTNGDLGLTGIRQGTSTASGFRSSRFPHAAVNPVSGNIYVTYNDTPGGDKGNIYLVQSTTGGATWSAPILVNDDGTTRDQWQPTIAVTQTGDRLGVFYYSRQEDPGNNLFKYYGRVGVISGGTVAFAPSFPVSQVASLPEFGRDSLINTVYMGDYNTVAVTPSGFHAVWGDNRDDLALGPPRKDPNIYYQKIDIGFAVASTVPALGSVIATTPTSFTVNVTEPYDSTTVDASDFSVNGIPATSFTLDDADTITFSFGASPVTMQGLQTMHIDAGAILRLADAAPILVFDGTFRYDLLALQVTSTVPPVGGVFTLPAPFTYDVNFNEPVNPASVQTGDLALSGIAGATVTGVVVQPGNMTATFTIGGVTTEGTLTASIPAGVITDAFGNGGLAFSGSYVVDIGTVGYPTPLAAKNPRGSLIYDPSASGTIGFPGDVDTFTIPIDPNQTISIVVSPTSAGLRPSVTLTDPASSVIASATAPLAGQNALIQTVATTTAGTYSIAVTGAAGTIGGYTVQLTLNSAIEEEGVIAGASNNTLATAQDIDPSFITLNSPARRGAVLGTTDSANYSGAAVPFAFEDISTTGTVIAGLTSQDDASVSIPVGFTFPMYGITYTTVFVSSNGLLTFGTGNTSFSNADLTTTPAQAAIAPFWDDLHTGGGVAGSNVYFQVLGSGSNQHVTIQWNKIRFFSGGTTADTITFQAQLYVDGRIQLNYSDLVSGTAAGNNGASATVGIKDAGTQGPNRLLLAFNNGPNAFVGTGQSTLISPPNPQPDYYAFTAAAGDTVTLALKGFSSSLVNVTLLDSGGMTLATGVGGSANLDNVISNYVVGGGGSYYARVLGGATTQYSLVVGRNTAFDTEPNDTFATAQPVAGNRGALGAMTPSLVYAGQAQPFAFEDISGTGTVIAGLTNQDDASASIPVGFAFPMYGASYTTVFASSNGLLTFGTGNTGFTNADLTTTPTQAAIAPFWDDLHTGGGAADSNVYFQVLGSGANQHVTIQWNKVRFFSGGTTGDTITFQAQLYADGRIQFNYQDLASGTAAGNNGASATVGIKDVGTQGPNRLLLAFNNGPNAFVGTGQSTLVSAPPTDDWYTVTVTGSTLEVVTSTPADGPGEFVNVLDPHIELYSPGNVLVASGLTLGDGRNERINTAGLTAGDYRVRVTAQSSTTGEYFFWAGPGAAVNAAGQALTVESCIPANGQIDPGERVTVSLTLKNNLTTSTSNLVATLLSGTGVTIPSNPQTYGALAPGASAARAFAFTADPSLTSGQQITATLQLQDGASSLGTASFLFTAGPLTTCGGVRLTFSSQLVRLNASTVQATVTVQNIGTVTANGVMITSEKLGSTVGAPLPQNLGNLAPGATAAGVFTFVNSTPGVLSTLSTGGTYSGGTFGNTVRVTIP